MRIAYVLYNLAPAGAEHAVRDLATGLQQRGHACHVVALVPPMTLAPSLAASGIGSQCANIGRDWNAGVAILRLVRILRRLAPDVIHAHLFYPSFYAASAALVTRQRLVVTFHNLGFDSYPPRHLADRAVKLTFKALMRVPKAHVAVSEPVARHYADNLALQGIDVISNPLPRLDRNRITPLQRSGSDESKIVLCVGRLVHEKGQRHAIETVAELAARGIDARLRLAGGGVAAPQLEQQAAGLNIADRVAFLGELSREQVHEEMLAADLVVAPSTHEGYGLAVFEAMALGRPIIAFRVGGLVELLADGRAGVLVEPGDTRALAAESAQLLADPPRAAELGAAAQQEAERRVNSDASIDLHEALYARVAA